MYNPTRAVCYATPGDHALIGRGMVFAIYNFLSDSCLTGLHGPVPSNTSRYASTNLGT